MPTDVFLILGGGGHARVVVDAWIKSGGRLDQVAVYDDNPALAGRTLVPGINVVAGLDRATLAGRAFHVAIGNNSVRDSLLRDLARLGAHARTVIHPSASIAAGTDIAGGSFVAAHAIVGPAAVVAAGAILNHGCVVDHDCRVGLAAHIAPGAVLGGGVVVGARVLVGAGAVILPGIRLHDNAVIGAGAVVTKDVAIACTVAGVPARTSYRHA